MNSTTKSLNKVYEFLKEHKQATPTELGTELNLNYNSVLACLEVLKEMDKVNSVSNGKITLISIKQNGN
jgi:Mn-dependent DtxR family transcriptional regulator|tara:strand:+ start:483 stop:689 length:207 start_codon:yes stop_codon:yes gene_type:complete